MNYVRNFIITVIIDVAIGIVYGLCFSNFSLFIYRRKCYVKRRNVFSLLG